MICLISLLLGLDDDVVDVRDRDNDAEDEENRKEREKALLAEKRTKTFQRLTLLHGQDYLKKILFLYI